MLGNENAAIGQVIMIFKCRSCDEFHTHLIGPLDERYNTIGIGLEIASVWEEVIGATQCKLLVTCANHHGNYLVAIERNGETLTGTCREISRAEADKLNTAQEAFAYAARFGLALEHQPANHGGGALMLINALETELVINANARRLLQGIEINLP